MGEGTVPQDYAARVPVSLLAATKITIYSWGPWRVQESVSWEIVVWIVVTRWGSGPAGMSMSW